MFKISSSETNIGDFLRELRGNRSLRDIQKISGVSYTHLRSIENGVDPRSGNKIVPTPDTLRKLAKAYDYPYLDLAEKAGIISQEDAMKIKKTKRAFNPLGTCDRLIYELVNIREDYLQRMEEDLNALILKYKSLVGDSFKFNRKSILSLGQQVEQFGSLDDYKQLLGLYVDVLEVKRKHSPLLYPRADLYYEIKHPFVTYKGISLNDQEKHELSVFLDDLIQKHKEE